MRKFIFCWMWYVYHKPNGSHKIYFRTDEKSLRLTGMCTLHSQMLAQFDSPATENLFVLTGICLSHSQIKYMYWFGMEFDICTIQNKRNVQEWYADKWSMTSARPTNRLSYLWLQCICAIPSRTPIRCIGKIKFMKTFHLDFNGEHADTCVSVPCGLHLTDTICLCMVLHALQFNRSLLYAIDNGMCVTIRSLANDLMWRKSIRSLTYLNHIRSSNATEMPLDSIGVINAIDNRAHFSCSGPECRWVNVWIP